jgi:hypothetical protein
MKLVSLYKALCLPSKVYLVLSFIGILLTILMPSILGGVSIVMHVFHVIYAVFWTWVLNLICKAGYKWISWVLVLAPFVLAFILVVSLGSGAVVEVPVVVVAQR